MIRSKVDHFRGSCFPPCFTFIVYIHKHLLIGSEKCDGKGQCEVVLQCGGVRQVGASERKTTSCQKAPKSCRMTYIALIVFEQIPLPRCSLVRNRKVSVNQGSEVRVVDAPRAGPVQTFPPRADTIPNPPTRANIRDARKDYGSQQTAWVFSSSV